MKGLDCANCANKIENELRKNKGFEFATVNFATKTLALDADSEELAKNIIGNIEPSVELLRADSGARKEQESLGTWSIVRIIASAVLLLVGILFGRQLRATAGDFAEYVVLVPAYLLVGYPVLKSAWMDLLRGRIFNEMFLMAIATVGAFAIGQLPEAVGVMLFYSVGEYLQERAVARSRSSISRLMNLRPEFARIVTAGQGRIVDPEQVIVGDIVEVRPGERVPLDGTIVEGESFVDTSSLTGEAVPRSVGIGEKVKAGYVNDTGRILVEVSAPFGQSSAARIPDLVENAATHKAPTEKFITKVAAYYTPFVVISAALIAFVPPLLIP
ncbi:MAG: heavy metal translocating P-type ATPase, partial [Candidatus Hydrogenedentales bacterium]